MVDLLFLNMKTVPSLIFGNFLKENQTTKKYTQQYYYDHVSDFHGCGYSTPLAQCSNRSA